MVLAQNPFGQNKMLRLVEKLDLVKLIKIPEIKMFELDRWG